jgi:hypothetical protein
VAHTYNPSYSGCRDQEDRGSRPSWAKFVRPVSKMPNTKKDWENGSSGRVPA